MKLKKTRPVCYGMLEKEEEEVGSLIRFYQSVKFLVVLWQYV